MNKDQFIYWLKGFAKAVNEEGPTPGQWKIIASELGKIKDCPDFGSSITSDGNIVRGWENSWEDPLKSIYGDDGSIRPNEFIQNSGTINSPYNVTLTTTSNKDIVYTVNNKD
jgi:hypothetical protein